MGSKHTPGPWHVANGVQVRSEKDQLARVWMMRTGEGKANARLIAAAPELLEAIEELLSATQHLNPCPATVEKARAAIAKAKGEEQ